MVLTGSMAQTGTGTGLHRRRVLGVIAGFTLGVTTLSGCRRANAEPQPSATPDQLQPLLTDTLELISLYERAIVTQPTLSARLTPLAADHRAHADELTKLISASPAPTPSATQSLPVDASWGRTSADVLAKLRFAEQAGQQSATAVSMLAAADRVLLAASVAACRATHVEALR